MLIEIKRKIILITFLVLSIWYYHNDGDVADMIYGGAGKGSSNDIEDYDNDNVRVLMNMIDYTNDYTNDDSNYNDSEMIINIIIIVIILMVKIMIRRMIPLQIMIILI